MQKALLQYWDVSQHDLAREALILAKRGDLIGSREHHLVPPATGRGALSIHERRKREAGREAAQGRLGKRGNGTRPAGGGAGGAKAGAGSASIGRASGDAPRGRADAGGTAKASSGRPTEGASHTSGRRAGGKHAAPGGRKGPSKRREH